MRYFSTPIRDRYARSAQAHREAMRSASLPLLAAVVGLVAAYACVFYLLIK